MRSDRIRIGLAVLALAGLGATLAWGASLLAIPWDWQHLVGMREHNPVLVVVVGDTKNLAEVRAALTPGEILAESKGAFALRHRQVIAASPEDVGPLLMRVGWEDAPIELRGAIREAAPQPPAAVSSDRELMGLTKKPSLSELEAHRLLELTE